MTFADVRERADLQGARAPKHTITVQPEEFADTWEKRPRAPVVFGLRSLPAEEDTIARKQAGKAAVTAFPHDVYAQAFEYSLVLQAWAVARSICDPNNVQRSHPSLPSAEDTIRSAMTGPCITRIFDFIEKNQIETSPCMLELTAETQLELVEKLQNPEAFAHLSDASEGRARRLAGFLLEELTLAQD